MMEGSNMEVLGTNTTSATNTGNGGSPGVPAAAPVSAGEANKAVKVIKRYQNRKLYDTHQSCYVTLDEIAEMIMRGEDVTVVDNRTKKDITSSTLTQIIFE